MRASRRALRNVRRMSVRWLGVYLNRGSRIDRVTGLLIVTSEWRWDEGRRLTLLQQACVDPAGEGKASLNDQHAVASAAHDCDGDAVEQEVAHSGKKGHPASKQPRIVPSTIMARISSAVFMCSPSSKVRVQCYGKRLHHTDENSAT